MSEPGGNTQEININSFITLIFAWDGPSLKDHQHGISGPGVTLAIWVISEAMFQPRKNACLLSSLENWAPGI